MNTILSSQPSATPGRVLLHVEQDQRQLRTDPADLIRYWSYADARWPNTAWGAGSPVHRHATPEAAQAFLAEYTASYAGEGEALSRAEYEAACAELNVSPVTDQECGGSGITHGEFAFPEYPVATCVSVRLVRRRHQGLAAEARTQTSPPADAVVVLPEPEEADPRPEVVIGTDWETGLWARVLDGPFQTLVAAEAAHAHQQDAYRWRYVEVETAEHPNFLL